MSVCVKPTPRFRLGLGSVGAAGQRGRRASKVLPGTWEISQQRKRSEKSDEPIVAEKRATTVERRGSTCKMKRFKRKGGSRIDREILYGRGDCGDCRKARSAAVSETCALQGEAVTESKGGAEVSVLLPVRTVVAHGRAEVRVRTGAREQWSARRRQQNIRGHRTGKWRGGRVSSRHPEGAQGEDIPREPRQEGLHREGERQAPSARHPDHKGQGCAGRGEAPTCRATSTRYRTTSSSSHCAGESRTEVCWR